MAVDTWLEPDPGDFYVIRDDNNEPLAVCRYLDLVADLDPEDWPDSQVRYDDLMFAYNAIELSQ